MNALKLLVTMLWFFSLFVFTNKNQIFSSEANGWREVDACSSATKVTTEKKIAIDYQKNLQAVLDKMKDIDKMVLSTSHNDHVTSRTISTACSGERVYFITWGHHQKCIQINKNPKVALCHNQLQMEGVAKILGNPLDKENEIYNDIYKIKRPEIYRQFSSFAELVIVEITVAKISFNTEKNGKFLIETIDLANKKAWDFSMYKDSKKQL